MLIYVVSYIYFYMPDMVACRHILFYVHDSDRMMRIILDLSQAYLYVDSVRDDMGELKGFRMLQSIISKRVPSVFCVCIKDVCIKDTVSYQINVGRRYNETITNRVSDSTDSIPIWLLCG